MTPTTASPPLDPKVQKMFEEMENLQLVAEDGENMESPWHRDCMMLLIQVVLHFLRNRTDFYVGGYMFLYFNLQQIRNQDFRGPDFFLVNGGVELFPQRDFWATWNENGRYPDVIVELLSPTTAHVDRTTKKDIYERTFHTPNYYCYDPATRALQGWSLGGGNRYQPLQPNDRGWLWCSELGLWLGTWEGEFLRIRSTWLRFYDAEGNLVLTAEEEKEHRAEREHRQAQEEHRRAETERQRADAAEAELVRLRALLQQQGQGNGPAAPAS